VPIVDAGDLIFVTQNRHKFVEAAAIALERGVALIRYEHRSMEIQSEDVNEIAAHKARSAYGRLGRPLFVEHTSLHLDWLNGFPAGYTSAFMQSFGDDRICALFGVDGRREATGRTTIGYHDGRRVRIFSGATKGYIVDRPAGATADWGGFGWNRIFAPDPGTRTFSELGVGEKNRISMRRTAMYALLDELHAP
jgi:XTP/dITP diphosphohydrolase